MESIARGSKFERLTYATGHSRRKRLGPLATHVRCTSKS